MRYSNGYSNSSSGIGVYPIEHSKSSSSWMTTALTCSRRNSSTSSTLPETRTGECWYGLEGPRSLHLPQRQPLHHRCNRSSRNKTYRHKSNLYLLPLIPPKQNDAKSP